MKESDRPIILVEDSPYDAELTLDALAEHHLANPVVVLRDGAAAVDYLFAEGAYAGRDLGDRPAVILLDLKLPRLNGLQVLQRIKGDPRTRVIPVVMLTSSREEPDIAEAYRLGANSYIVKPVDFEQFSEAVRQVGLYWVVINQGLPC